MNRLSAVSSSSGVLIVSVYLSNFPVLARVDMPNGAIAREIQISIQYMWQHVQWIGVKGYATKDAFEGIARQEMKHAESIAERLFYLGEIPTTNPEPINVGKTLKEMVA
jgi:bacterioferritin